MTGATREPVQAPLDLARRLGLNAKTVANHVSNILTRLQVQNRAEAIDVARKAGLENYEARYGEEVARVQEMPWLA